MSDQTFRGERESLLGRLPTLLEDTSVTVLLDTCQLLTAFTCPSFSLRVRSLHLYFCFVDIPTVREVGSERGKVSEVGTGGRRKGWRDKPNL